MKKWISALLALILCPLLSTCAYAEVPEPDYLGMMVDAAVCGDLEAGVLAAQGWNEKLLREDSLEPAIDFEELFLLSKLITREAGSVWLREELRRCVGEVVLNRMDSPEFPDTMEEVIFQDGQYENVDNREFREEFLPTRACVRAALKALRGERLLPPLVVFQSNGRLGKVHATYCDRVLGFTYFCETNHPELYGVVS